MRKLANLINKYAATISMLFLVIIWQGAGNLGLLPKYIIPTPIEIVKAFIKNYQLLIFHSKITLLEAIIGLFLGIVIAWLLALIMDSIPIFNKTIYPLLVLTQTNYCNSAYTCALVGLWTYTKNCINCFNNNIPNSC